MPKERKVISLVIACVMIFQLTMLSSIISASSKTDIGTSEKVKKVVIAVAGPFSGDDQAIGVDMRTGVEIAVDEAKNEFSKMGLELVLVSQDDAASPKDAVSIAYKLAVNPNIMGVIGHLNSGCSIPASEIYHKNGLVMITPVSTADKLTAPGYPEIVRIVLKNSQQGSAMANYSKKTLNANTYVIIDDRSEYGLDVAREFDKEASSLGMTNVGAESYQRGTRDFRPMITKIRLKNPDVIYLGGMYKDCALLIKQARSLGLKSQFLSGDGMYAEEELVKVGGKSVEGCIVSYLAPPWGGLEKARSFLQNYERRTGRKVISYAPIAYDATNILLSVIKDIGKDVNRSKIIQALKDPNFKYHGITGTVLFDSHGDLKDPVCHLYALKEGSFHYIGKAGKGE